MGDYEKSQKYLQRMWDDVMSDEEPDPFTASSSESYQPSSDSSQSSSDFECKPSRTLRKLQTPRNAISVNSLENPVATTSAGKY